MLTGPFNIKIDTCLCHKNLYFIIPCKKKKKSKVGNVI